MTTLSKAAERGQVDKTATPRGPLGEEARRGAGNHERSPRTLRAQRPEAARKRGYFLRLKTRVIFLTGSIISMVSSSRNLVVISSFGSTLPTLGLSLPGFAVSVVLSSL